MDLPLAFQLQVDNNMSEGDVPANLIPTDEEASAMLEMEKSMDSIILNAATANLDKAIDLSDLDTNSVSHPNPYPFSFLAC